MAVVVLVIFVTIGLSLWCIIRKRRKGEKKTVASNQDDNKDDSGDTQLYLQQKVELDDEQRRHEKDGDDRIYELTGGKR